jgi:hypothetical protein
VSEEPYGKSQTEMAVETFVDRVMEIHPNLDREEFNKAIQECVQNVVPAEEEGEASGG